MSTIVARTSISVKPRGRGGTEERPLQRRRNVFLFSLRGRGRTCRVSGKSGEGSPDGPSCHISVRPPEQDETAPRGPHSAVRPNRRHQACPRAWSRAWSGRWDETRWSPAHWSPPREGPG